MEKKRIYLSSPTMHGEEIKYVKIDNEKPFYDASPK